MKDERRETAGGMRKEGIGGRNMQGRRGKEERG